MHTAQPLPQPRPMIPRLLRFTLAAALLTVMANSACSGPTSPSSTAPLVDRIGGTWMLVSRQLPGESAAPPPGTATFSLQIADGRAGIRADCNQCGGPAAIGGNTVTVGPAVACTRVFCPSAPYDDTFVRILSGESEATIEGDSLTLRSDRGVLRFRR